MSDPKPAWHDRAFNATVAGGLIVAAVTWFVPWAISESTKDDAPVWVYFLVAGAALLVLSLVVPTWRRLIWNNVAKGFQWLFAIRPMTRRAREAMIMAAAEAAASLPLPQPRWDVTSRGWSGSSGNVSAHAVLHNRMPNSVARGVRIEPTNTDARITSSAYWEDLSGQTSGSFNVSVSGGATENGTPLSIEWYDQNGERQKHSVRMNPFFDDSGAPYIFWD